jgi:sugar transferase (PEP-CTERM/EpsH1 system associated)
VDILLVCHRFPFPPRSGAKIRAYHMVRHLARAHRVTVASLVRDEVEAAEAAGIAETGARHVVARVREPLQVARMALRLPTPVPSTMGYFHSPLLHRRIRALLARERFDLVIAHSSSTAPYVVDAAVPKLMDFCDMDSQKWITYARHQRFPLSAGYAIEGAKLERAERRMAGRFDVCTVATPGELASLQALGTARAADWFPNGVDGDHFTPSGEAPRPDHLVFVGRMDYYPNARCMVEFCNDVLPLVRARRPAVTLAIVGAAPVAPVRALAALPGVTVTGSVPDVRPHAQRASVMVAPLAIARGTQNKILEGMAMGIPVVASGEAAKGVDAEAPEHLLVASSPREHAAAILRLLDDPVERARLAAAGRARALSHHSWGKAMRRLDAILDAMLARPGEARVSLAVGA